MSLPSKSISSSTKPPPKESQSIKYAKRATGETSRKTKAPKPPNTVASSVRPNLRAEIQGRPDRKTAYRTVLDNPLQIDWPVVPLNVENAVLACVVELLDPVRLYNERRDARQRGKKSFARAQARKKKVPQRKARKPKDRVTEAPSAATAITDAAVENGTSERDDGSSEKPLARKRKRPEEEEDDDDISAGGSPVTPAPKRLKRDQPKPDDLSASADQMGVSEHNGQIQVDSAAAPNDDLASLPKPEMLDHVVIGLNEVTKRLEAQSRALRSRSSTAPTSNGVTPAEIPDPSSQTRPIPFVREAIRLVIVCRTDIDSPTMIAHFPTLVAACNSARPSDTDKSMGFTEVIMVGLPQGAESALAEASGLRRAAVLAFDNETPGLDRLTPFLPSIPILKAPWLAVHPASDSTTNTTSSAQLVPTHIKHIKTTVPKDIKAAKKKRLEEKATAKTQKAAKQQAVRRLGKIVISGRSKSDGKGLTEGSGVGAT